jgi:hypothetical protein
MNLDSNPGFLLPCAPWREFSHPSAEEMKAMRATRIASCVMGGMIVLAAGCHSKIIDKAQFRSALDNYYSSQQDCLWPAPIKLPAQADATNEDQTKGFDALTDAGLLKRMPAEKKRFLVGSKRVNNYDLSAQGRSHWTADPAQPGYGNFCFGHPEVSSIDEIAPNTGGETQYSVGYRFGLTPPAWADTAEIKTAFPSTAELNNGQTATATLTRSGGGWQVQNVSPSNGAPQP